MSAERFFLRDGILHQTFYTIQVSKQGSVGNFDANIDSSLLMITVNDKYTMHIFVAKFFLCFCGVSFARVVFMHADILDFTLARDNVRQLIFGALCGTAFYTTCQHGKLCRSIYVYVVC